MIHINETNAVDYLRERGQVPAEGEIEVRSLGGGISNTVLLIEWPDDSFILTQPLEQLRVQEKWQIHRRRVFNERDAMQFANQLLPPGHVPAVRFSDEENFVITMSRADRRSVSWKQQLLAGQVDLSVAESAGSLLALLHNRAAGNESLKKRLGDQQILIEARVDPYFRTASRRHPDLKPIIDDEIERLLATALTLVHGDYSPKNLLVGPDQKLVMIDFEVAHYGDPAFDVAFCLALMILGAVCFRRQTVQQLAAVKAMWNAYVRNIQILSRPQIEATTIRQLGCTLLARIDGKSKVEYINDEPTRDLVRSMSRDVLQQQWSSIEDILIAVRERVGLSGGSRP